MVQGESQAQQQLIDSLRRRLPIARWRGCFLVKCSAPATGAKNGHRPRKSAFATAARMDSTEFAAIVGNLLDNAFEAACVAMKETRSLNYSSAMKAICGD